jgi:hypothetical protein
MTVRSAVSYPDIRVIACPQGTINLTKYIDSSYFQSITWTPSNAFQSGGINNGVLLNTSSLIPGSTYMYEYELNNACQSANRGILYLTVVNNGKVIFDVIEVKICKDQASMINLNAIFGIESGNGAWTAIPFAATPYIEIVSGMPFDGQAFFRGKDAWDNNIGNLNGGNREITITYTPAISTCLSGKYFNVKLIITPNL